MSDLVIADALPEGKPLTVKAIRQNRPYRHGAVIDPRGVWHPNAAAAADVWGVAASSVCRWTRRGTYGWKYANLTETSA